MDVSKQFKGKRIRENDNRVSKKQEIGNIFVQNKVYDECRFIY